ncbi:MAG: quinone-dependent dihydroorotate dehydrogenase [Bacteroidetes bacterium QS_8_68_15]|nr:MAG: quinone-dependent dihydroorotate dehydrogenase [Bacteroidetes bacterium QS_8_68_15]
MYRFLRPLLFRMGAEEAHGLATGAARLAQQLRPATLEPLFRFEDAALYQNLWGLDFKNPVGLAAGFDKNAELVRFWEALGFGFSEAGSVTARPAEGNAKPRAFRLPEDRALVNRMGLGNEGADAVARRLEEADGPAASRTAPLGVNVAKTPAAAAPSGNDAVEDYRQTVHRLAPLADYVTLNVSCPNTETGHTFEDPAALRELLDAVFAERERLRLTDELPVLVKLSPPETGRLLYDSTLDDTVAVALAKGVDGFVAANTTPDRPKGLSASPERLADVGDGGLSGPPVAGRATALVRYLYRLTDGAVPIVGVGGVDSADAAYEKIRAGASLVQLYTGLVYEGPGLVKRIKEGLAERLAADGFGSVPAAVGTAAVEERHVGGDAAHAPGEAQATAGTQEAEVKRGEARVPGGRGTISPDG